MAKNQTLDKSQTTKKNVLGNVKYARICQFINCFNSGLPMDCELDMVHNLFTDVKPLALICILQTEIFNYARGHHWRHEQYVKKMLKNYEDQCLLSRNNSLIVRTASMESINPIALCRLLLQEKYELKQRPQVSSLLKVPHLIDNSLMADNVQQCLYSDNQEGPVTDLRRRLVGEEYELKLKHLAKKAGIYFYDEQDLRRMGYDKTPDIKLILPFLYKGLVVNWIESKANFGDPRSHKWNIQQQLYSYCNRFGPGIIIYWFGYHEETSQLPDNNIGITVLTDFPALEDLVFMQLSEQSFDI